MTNVPDGGVVPGAHGSAPSWAPLPVQYADYALWEREVLGGLDDPGSLLSGQLGHWRQTLAGLPDELPLPTDRPRPAVASFRGGSVPIAVDARTHARLAAVAQRGGGTVFMVAQAALALLLARMGAGSDIPVGTVVAGRGDPATEDLVGCFLNTLVLRTNVGGDPSFTELLARVRDTDLAAYAHQDLPFELLVDELNPPRSLARHPLVQVVLNFQNIPRGEEPLRLPGLRVTAVPPDEGTAAGFDLSVTLGERRDADGAPAGLVGDMQCRPARDPAHRLPRGPTASRTRWSPQTVRCCGSTRSRRRTSKGRRGRRVVHRPGHGRAVAGAAPGAVTRGVGAGARRAPHRGRRRVHGRTRP
ncbi:hypothetical protein SFUMM280S_02118 [Streptomyces fumanus]